MSVWASCGEHVLEALLEALQVRDSQETRSYNHPTTCHGKRRGSDGRTGGGERSEAKKCGAG